MSNPPLVKETSTDLEKLLNALLQVVKPELPLVIETPGEEKPWGVSLGGFNPDAPRYFECPDEDSAWRLHDLITLLVMRTDPNLSQYANSETISRDLLDQMTRRQWR